MRIRSTVIVLAALFVSASAWAQESPPAPSASPMPSSSEPPPSAPPPTPTPSVEELAPAPAAVPPEAGGHTPFAPPKNEPPPEDRGVGFKWVWLVPELGFSYVNLKSFSETNLAVVDSSKSGAMAGVGAGVRIVFLTLGVRARRHFAMDMWQVMGEAALHLKVNRVDPYLAFRGGYDTIGSSFGAAVGNATGSVNVDVKGFNLGAALGFDYFVADNVTLGAEGSGDFLFLTRPLPPLPAGITPAQKAVIEQNPLYKQSGSSVGFGGSLAARLGVHF